MGRCRRSGLPPVPGGEDAVNVVLRAPASPDFEQGAHDGPHHAVQESVGRDHEHPVVIPCFRGPSGLKDRTDPVLRIAGSPAERVEILAPDQHPGCPVHRIKIRWRAEHDTPGTVQRPRFGTRVIVVRPDACIIPGMELGRRNRKIQDGYARRQNAVKGGPQAVRIDVHVGVEVGNLAARMYTGVRPSGTRDPHPRPEDSLQCFFDGLLNRRLVRLDLPAVPIRSVVFEGHPVGCHFRYCPLMKSDQIHTRIYLAGFMGSGKSTAGARAARQLGLEFVDLDNEIENLAGRSVKTLFAVVGEAGFRAIESEALESVCRRDHILVALGGGAILDPDNRALVKRTGLLVYLHAPAEVLADRLTRSRTIRPLLFNDDGVRLSGEELLSRVKAILDDRAEAYADAHITIDADNDSSSDTARRIATMVRNYANR